MSSAPASWSAIVLSGGRGERLGGVAKAEVEFEGRTLLDRALDAVTGAGEVVVVGDTPPTSTPVLSTREDPPYGGPVAGLAAGLETLARPSAYVVILAVDMPRITRATVARLLAAAEPAEPVEADAPDGAILTDPEGRRQLALAVRTDRLRAVLPAPEERHGLPLRRFLAPLGLVEIAGRGQEYRDIDTWADLRSLG
ncbi:molybdenum cofactor guanylyltransferase [Nocardioides insulae]|uniref:molybdenum cofactor guanylyltransferase n=1 Tax=Nocardioides insulae TaxID=394734 RepID=UPI0004158E1E|nr:molybdenum cofactor guanylyltransferase [Nocardioides insulae]